MATVSAELSCFVSAAAGVFDVRKRSEPLPRVDGESKFAAEEARELTWCYDDTQR